MDSSSASSGTEGAHPVSDEGATARGADARARFCRSHALRYEGIALSQWRDIRPARAAAPRAAQSLPFAQRVPMLGVPRRAMRGRIVSRTAWLPLLCLLVLPQREASAQIPYGRFRQARSQARRGDLNNPMSVARRRLAQVSCRRGRLSGHLPLQHLAWNSDWPRGLPRLPGNTVNMCTLYIF